MRLNSWVLKIVNSRFVKKEQNLSPKSVLRLSWFFDCVFWYFKGNEGIKEKSEQTINTYWANSRFDIQNYYAFIVKGEWRHIRSWCYLRLGSRLRGKSWPENIRPGNTLLRLECFEILSYLICTESPGTWGYLTENPIPIIFIIFLCSSVEVDHVVFISLYICSWWNRGAHRIKAGQGIWILRQDMLGRSSPKSIFG